MLYKKIYIKLISITKIALTNVNKNLKVCKVLKVELITLDLLQSFSFHTRLSSGHFCPPKSLFVPLKMLLLYLDESQSVKRRRSTWHSSPLVLVPAPAAVALLLLFPPCFLSSSTAGSSGHSAASSSASLLSTRPSSSLKRS